MNARQMKKRLKKQINKLQSDNDLMRRIIADSREMSDLYYKWTRPSNVTHIAIPFQEYKAKRCLPPDRSNDIRFIASFKREIATALFESIKDNITYEIDTECIAPIVTASILVGRKEE